MCSNPTGPRKIWALILGLYQFRVAQQIYAHCQSCPKLSVEQQSWICSKSPWKYKFIKRCIGKRIYRLVHLSNRLEHRKPKMTYPRLNTTHCIFFFEKSIPKLLNVDRWNIFVEFHHTAWVSAQNKTFRTNHTTEAALSKPLLIVQGARWIVFGKHPKRRSIALNDSNN